MKWIPYAMVRVMAFFAAGVLLGIYFQNSIPLPVASTLFAILMLIYGLGYILWRKRHVIKMFSGVAGLLCIFLGGYINLHDHTESKMSNHLLQLHKPVAYYLATLNTAPEERAKTWRMQAEVKFVKLDSGWQEASGKVLLYLSKKSEVQHLQYGDVVMVKGAPVELGPPANPYEFDFKRFLSFKNIFHQQFVRGNQVRVITSGEARGFLYYSQVARDWATDKLKSVVEGAQEQAIALALVLGVTDGLDNDLQNAYAASGAMHVLAVSGLHVGIIYWMILLLLKPIRIFSWSGWPIALISLVCLWSYAFITGLSPSVLRAVTMFSFIAVAKPFSRSTNIYNTLAASAFILLLYNPYLIMSVGFQLSYLAVLGIVYLQRPLYYLWEPQNRFIDWCWSITCVSIAAQIATFALGLLYFHQFPVYFLFSNLFVIPGSFVVLVLGIAVLALSFIPAAAAGLGWLLEWSIRILNAGVFAVEDLPFSLINGVYITTFQCWLLMGMIAAFIFLFEFRKFHWMLAAAALVLVFAGIQWQQYYQEIDRSRLVVYRVSGHGAMEWIHHGQSFFYADSLLIQDEERMRFHIRPNRIGNGISVVTVNDPPRVREFKHFRYFDFDGVTVLWINQSKTELPNGMVADYLLIGNNGVKSLAQVVDHVKFRKIILDSSNSGWFEQRLLREAAEKNIPVHSVLKQGAFNVTL